MKNECFEIKNNIKINNNIFFLIIIFYIIIIYLIIKMDVDTQYDENFS